MHRTASAIHACTPGPADRPVNEPRAPCSFNAGSLVVGLGCRRSPHDAALAGPPSTLTNAWVNIIDGARPRSAAGAQGQEAGGHELRHPRLHGGEIVRLAEPARQAIDP